MTPAKPRHAHGYAIASAAIALIFLAAPIASVVAP
jgi:hypothetical protein